MDVGERIRKGVLVSPGKGRHKNLGDYVQSIAAAQFAGTDPVLLDREHLDTYADASVKTVMNAWFMSNPRHFPPSDAIRPLFASFHVTPTIEERFFTPETVAYLKRFEPIGCRSTDVVDMLRRRGIRAEFSSCLTLTLGRTFCHRETSDAKPIFVDPFFRRPSQKAIGGFVTYVLGRLPHMFAHFAAVRRIAERFRVFSVWPRSRFAPVRWAYAAEFHQAYSTFFTEDVLLSAEYLTHKLPRRKDFCNTVLMKLAADRLHLYETASFVVTSRLHCALPCLAMKTPLWFVFDPAMATGRFGGNLRFLNEVRIGGVGRLIADASGRKGMKDRPPVRTDHEPFARSLADRVDAFMREG